MYKIYIDSKVRTLFENAFLPLGDATFELGLLTHHLQMEKVIKENSKL